MSAVRQSAGESFLGRMASSSRARVREARKRESEAALLARALATPPAPPLRLGAFGMIAELKYRSPAAGTLAAQNFDGDAQVRAYGAGGAAAVSVLTEPEEFRGSLDDLRKAAEPLTAYRIPAMRKDFLTDPYQVLEARAAGAGGVLVIVTMLDDAEIAELLACATPSAGSLSCWKDSMKPTWSASAGSARRLRVLRRCSAGSIAGTCATLRSTGTGFVNWRRTCRLTYRPWRRVGSTAPTVLPRLRLWATAPRWWARH